MMMAGLLVPADFVTGAHYDTYLDLGALAAGNYQVMRDAV